MLSHVIAPDNWCSHSQCILEPAQHSAPPSSKEPECQSTDAPHLAFALPRRFLQQRRDAPEPRHLIVRARQRRKLAAAAQRKLRWLRWSQCARLVTRATKFCGKVMPVSAQRLRRCWRTKRPDMAADRQNCPRDPFFLSSSLLQLAASFQLGFPQLAHINVNNDRCRRQVCPVTSL